MNPLSESEILRIKNEIFRNTEGKPIDIPETMAYPFTKREVNRCKHTA
jgi:hypothetical protein